MLRTCLLTVLLLLPTYALAAPMAYDQKLRTYIEVRPLDDPANPFRAKYADWDRWMLANSHEHTDENPTPTEDRYANYYVLTGLVDENGWLLPQLEKHRAFCEWNRNNDINYTRIYRYEFHAAGAMEEDMLRSLRAACAKVRASYYPPVPQWLVAKRPLLSIILPDGRVVAAPHSGREDWPGLLDWNVPDTYYRGWELYSQSGELLSVTLPQSWWWEATIPHFRQLIEPYRQPGLNVVVKRGRVHVYLMDGEATTLVNFDWDGTPLPANLKLQEDRDGNPFLGIHGFDLPMIYAEQQRLALTAQAQPGV